MKVKITHRSEEKLEDYDYRGAVEYEITDDEGKKLTLSFFDGEPEDSNLSRDFNDVYSIGDLINLAFWAGERGETLLVEETESDEI
jgi:hypothetical protein